MGKRLRQTRIPRSIHPSNKIPRLDNRPFKRWVLLRQLNKKHLEYYSKTGNSQLGNEIVQRKIMSLFNVID